MKKIFYALGNALDYYHIKGININYINYQYIIYIFYN